MAVDNRLLKKVMRLAKEGHHPFGPSGLKAGMACPGKLAAEIDLPDEVSIYADEGSFAHDILANCLTNDFEASDLVGTVSQCGRFEWSPTDADQGQKYLDLVRDLIESGGELFVEVRLDLSSMIPEGYGTADVVILNYESKEIIVVDLKWGRGVPVDAEKNPQLMAYLIGAMDTYGLIDDFERFTGIICQPRIAS